MARECQPAGPVAADRASWNNRLGGSPPWQKRWGRRSKCRWGRDNVWHVHWNRHGRRRCHGSRGLLLLLSIYYQSCRDASWSTWHQNDPLCSRDVQLKVRLLRILGCFATPASMSSPWVKISTPRAWSINPASVCNKSDSDMPRALSPQISVFQRASQIRSIGCCRTLGIPRWVGANVAQTATALAASAIAGLA